MLIVAAVLVVVSLVTAGLVGIGPLAFDRRPGGDRVLGARGASMVLVVVGSAVAVVVIAVALGGLIGFRSGSGEDGEEPPSGGPAPSTSTTTGADRAGVDEGSGADRDSSVLGPVVRLRARDSDADSFRPPAEAVGGIRPDTVLRMRVTGFDEYATGRARQCVASEPVECGNAIGVQFDQNGTAAFQYLVTNRFGADARQGQCRLGQPRCSVVVESVDSDTRAEIYTVFIDALPAPGHVRVTPAGGLRDGSRVTVTVADFPPGAEAQILLCAAPADSGADRCRELHPDHALVVGADGTGSTTVTIRAGEVGTESVFCGRGRNCGLSVVAEALSAPAPVAVLGFAAPPGADYDPSRLGLGLAVAGLLLALASVLVRRTDWSPVGEEAAPEIDEADYADLDAIVAALPPEIDPDEVCSGTRY